MQGTPGWGGGTSPHLPGKENSPELVASKGQWGRETVLKSFVLTVLFDWL